MKAEHRRFVDNQKFIHLEHLLELRAATALMQESKLQRDNSEKQVTIFNKTIYHILKLGMHDMKKLNQYQ